MALLAASLNDVWSYALGSALLQVDARGGFSPAG